MTKWVAFLRGINVGGHRKVPMADLRELFASITSDPNVRTYIASGNVLFKADGTADMLAAALRASILKTFGFGVPTLVLNADQLQAVLQGCPCPNEKGNLAHAYLCFGDPVVDRDAVERLRTPSETVTVSGRTIWLHAPGGIGRSKLAVKMEGLLGVEATARNLNTVRKMVEIMGD